MKTRVSVAGYVGLLLLYLIFIPSAVISSTIPARVVFPSAFYGKLLLDTGISVMILFTSLIGRFVLIRSDVDNLLNYGVTQSRLFLSLFTFILIMVFPFLLVGGNVGQILTASFPVPTYLVLPSTVALIFISILISLFLLSRKGRIANYLFILISLLDFSNLIGNPFSMGNIATSQYIAGEVAVAAVLTLLTVLSYFTTMKDGFSPNITRRRYIDSVKRPIELKGRTGTRAAFMMGLLLNFTVGRNMYNPTANLPTRFSLRGQMIVTGVLATVLTVIYVYISVYLYNDPVAFMAFLLFILVEIMVAEFAYIFTFASMAHERLWIGFTAVGNLPFFRNHIIAKGLNATLTMAPMAIFPISLTVLGFESIFPSVVFSAVYLCVSIFPSAVISQILSAYLFPEQIRENSLPSRGVVQRFVILIPFFFMVFSALYAFLNLEYLIWATIGTYLVFILLFINTRVLENASWSMIKKGFV